MTSNPNDPKKKIKPNQEENQLSEEELESVAGGGIVRDLVDGAKDVIHDVVQTGKNIASDIKKVL